MIVLSNASVKSPWIEREVHAALEREDRRVWIAANRRGAANRRILPQYGRNLP
jgi:hypothetical protein